MIRKSTVLAAALASLAVAGTLTPQMAMAGAPERSQFKQCLADSAIKPNEILARSECVWDHWSYMASYGP
ncbi:MAG: hypothetical protein QNL90_09725 [Gammaproteobacteria bacterium]|nr:hypothetical protein [Gammaproteobacteria bacterium]